MDAVLDTLLQCISELIPLDKATVLFVEDGAELMVAREVPRSAPRRIGLTLAVFENFFLQRILFEKQAILLTNVAKQSDWRAIQPLDHLQSWLGIPLVAPATFSEFLLLERTRHHLHDRAPSPREITRRSRHDCHPKRKNP